MNDKQRFLTTVIASGLDFGMMSPDDVIEILNMEALAHHLPADLKARLLAASLNADSMSATLVLDTLGVEALVEHLPIAMSWQVVARNASRSLGEQAAPLPDLPVANPVENVAPDSVSTARVTNRKPNRSTRSSRVRNRATSRTRTASTAPAPEPESSPFDVDTRVGSEQLLSDFDGADETSVFPDSEDLTAHGKE